VPRVPFEKIVLRAGHADADVVVPRLCLAG